jgi:hypothetical protein
VGYFEFGIQLPLRGKFMTRPSGVVRVKVCATRDPSCGGARKDTMSDTSRGHAFAREVLS